MKVEELQARVVALTGMLSARGYDSITVCIETAEDRFRLSGNCYADNTYLPIYFSRETLPDFLASIPGYLDEKFPRIEEIRRRKFTEAMAELAKDADKLGETIPEFNGLAEMLREHLRSNLLESK